MEYKIFEPKYYEDLNVGDHWVTPTRTVTDADIVQFDNLGWITERIFVDEKFIKEKTLFKPTAKKTYVTLIFSVGLFTNLHLIDETALAMVGIEAKFMQPLFPGDTICVEVDVISKRETSKADRGIVCFKYTTKNQEDEILAETIETALIRHKASLA